MSSWIKKTSEVIYRIERPVLGILIAAVVILLFSNVILRYLFNAPLAWADEIARFLFTWTSFIGASAAIKKKGHVAIDNFVTRLSARNQAGVKLIGNSAIIIAMVFLIVYSIMMMKMFSSASLSSVAIPQNYLYVSLPLSAFFMIIHLAELMTEETKILRAGKGGK